MLEVDDIKKEIANLSLLKRAQIAHWVISSLDDINEPQDEIDNAWRAEIRIRVNDIKTGKVKMIPSSEMWEDLLGNYVKTS